MNSRVTTIRVDGDLDTKYKKLISEMRRNEKIISQEIVKDPDGKSFMVVVIETPLAKLKILLD
jgi:predicted transcriptional regulator